MVVAGKRLNRLLKNIGSSLTTLDVIQFCDQNMPEIEQGLLTGLRNVRRKEQKFQKTIAEIEYSAKELSGATQLFSNNTIEQSNSTASTAAAITQMSQGIEEVTERIRETSSFAQDARDLSSKGQGAIVRSREEIEMVAHLAKQTMDRVRELAERSQKVSDISKVIEEIADKTNLLALNAAIEAARAGENGRGFAVVADEVRGLANQCRGSAIEIASNVESASEYMINVSSSMESVIGSVEKCIDQTKDAESHLDGINEKNNSVSDQVGAITHISGEQELASREISSHIELVSAKAEDNSFMVKQCAAITEYFHQIAKRLK